MTELDQLRVWNDPATRRRLGWYREVAANRRPAKFRIAATIPLGLALDAAETDLWGELERLTPLFLERWHTIRRAACRWDAGLRGLRCSSFAVNSPSACSPIATSVAGTVGSTGPARRSSALASSVPARASRPGFTIPAKSWSIAARKGPGRSSLPHATCVVRSARMATSAPTRTMVSSSTVAPWLRWPGCCAWKAVTTSTGSAAKSQSTCTGSLRR